MNNHAALVEESLVQLCTTESLELLRRNLTPRGILAASRTEAAEARSYTRVFGRDAAICVLAMAGSGDAALEQGAVASLDSLAELQARNGQIPKYVDPEGQDADFWYLGCIDATLWWLIAVDHVRRHGQWPDMAQRWQPQVDLAINWLMAQEHQKFFLLQQNEASDWADIMPRSGFVLYTNALWYRVKLLFELPCLEETHYHFNHLFHPFKRDLPEYRRGRLLSHYARRGQRNPGLYLSFVNLSFVGDEGDVFGNILAVLYGLADDSMAKEVVKTLQTAAVAEPYPVRAVTTPIDTDHELWRAYMGRHQQNHPHQYHNGGIWPFIGGFWALMLAEMGKKAWAEQELAKLAHVNSLDDWRFTEWFHGQTLKPMGMAGQSWNAAAYLMAQKALGETGLSA
ncbi:glycoside hydrolase 100 family protein [Aquabacterium sp.]|uniref:amylo-alpha-1,6-glucosidase n=1 Tax=Aquabacterium sp. TaxID=1872578 RepID=UPI002489D00A|nr:glycoside hydrolase 100 family protein [Aquabacterium sp.]MDI1257769.1 glycoside hydrolase 100 family protein [Aquabacterium sp.]